MKKKQIINKGEKELLEQFEKGEFKQVANVRQEKARYTRYAKYTLSKPRNINIRVSHADLERIKAIAAKKGLPYQTLIGSLLHQYSTTKRADRVETY
ncbi:MAG: antitoxin [Parcubacteria group bacterium]|nr:antitoxin [Parcubacteria group bacterium]